MNVYAEIERIKNYELEQLITKLNECGGEYTYDEDKDYLPDVMYYDNFEGGGKTMNNVSRVKIAPDGAYVIAYGEHGLSVSSDDMLCGEMTELLNQIKSCC